MFSAQATRGSDGGGVSVTVRGCGGGGGVAHALHEALEGGRQRVCGHESVERARPLAVGVLVQRHGGTHRPPAAERRTPYQRRAAAHTDYTLFPQWTEYRYL